MADKKDGTISKLEGVRRAVAKLGLNATPAEIQTFLQDEFDIPMTLEHISNYKGKVRRELAAREQPAAEGRGQDVPAQAGDAAQPPGSISKREAVRRALGELGMDASAADIQDFARERFSLDVPPELATKYKSDIGRKASKQAPPEKITKKEGILRALAELGNGATPSEIRDFVKERFGLEVSPSHASATKGEALRGAGGASAPQEAAPAPPAPAQPALPEAGNGRGIALDDILKLRDLVDRVGADQLRRLLEVLSR
jgi:hypothetical protein